jgi:DNA-binding transcriptional ArsR family regulator
VKRWRVILVSGEFGYTDMPDFMLTFKYESFQVFAFTGEFMKQRLHEFKAEFFKGLGHPLRLAILDALREGERSVGELQETLSVDQSTVSHQLSILRQRGFLTIRKQATTVYYSTSDPEMYVFLDMGKLLFERHLQRSNSILSELQTRETQHPSTEALSAL